MDLRKVAGLLHKLTDPDITDFVEMGVGIEQRFERCRPYWGKHLDATKEFERTCVSMPPNGSSIAVLGAGRLLDLDLETMARMFQTIALFDIDPSVRTYWQAAQLRYGTAIQCHRVELTGSIQEWTKQLGTVLKKRRDLAHLCAFLNALEPNLDHNPVGEHGTVLSLNLIGQIPIYWRNRVHSMVWRKWGLHPNVPGNYPQEVEAALIHSMKVLELQHLDLLRYCARQKIILIGDTIYAYHDRGQPLWQTEALHFEWQSLKLNGFELRLQDSWLWEISPQGIEQSEFGITHAVRGWEFVRSSGH